MRKSTTVLRVTAALLAAGFVFGTVVGNDGGGRQGVNANQRQDVDVHAEIVLVSLKVKSTNKSGAAWDINGGKPDLVVRMRNVSDKNQKPFESKEKEDTFKATWNQATTLRVAAGQMIEIVVVDKDIAAHDIIGKTTHQITPKLLAKGRCDLSFGHVESLQLQFREAKKKIAVR